MGNCPPVHKAMPIKAWLYEFGVKELDWPTESSDLEHFWDELEGRTSVSDLTNAFLVERTENPIETLQNLVKSFLKGETDYILMSMDLHPGFMKAPVGVMFRGTNMFAHTV